MSLWIYRLRSRLAEAGAVLVLLMLTACAKSERSDDGRVPVGIHGVNYTAQEFGFVLVDPEDKENGAGEEAITAFGAGGTVCCFKLPKQWRAGLKAELRATVWIPPTPDKNLSSVKQSYVLDIPAYEQGKAAELWILRTADNEYSLVASNFQPDHPQWPGKTKGWPVPSVAYQKILHAKYLEEAQSDVDLYVSLLAGLKRQPVESAMRAWTHRMVSEADALKAYKGPRDAAFLAMLREEYLNGLVEAQDNVARVKATQP
ncbi:DUF3304 domain-containing protein [Massilia sp. TSP1-1-2]|uniref:DUF3304 domain-containing protein n=1 Tax=Massilia sp. TSP1-1-2 TaxID=2804649 RepID=UPI003CF969CC